MFQSVLISKGFTKTDIENKYVSELIKLGDIVNNNYNYGVNKTVNRLKFLKIKYLLSVVRFNDGEFNTLNSLNTALNN